MDELHHFLKKAKLATCANSNVVATQLRPNVFQLSYNDTHYRYEDQYVGQNFFTGQEIVYLHDEPHWSMVYSGGVLLQHEADNVYPFLQEALSHVPITAPFRGPAIYKNGKFVYKNKWSGATEKFKGEEAIVFDGHTVYRLQYSGGFIK